MVVYAATTQQQYIQPAAHNELRVLLSYLYKACNNKQKAEAAGVPVMIDSGAHTWLHFAQGSVVDTQKKVLAKINIHEQLEKYMQDVCGNVWPDAVWVELDVYGMLGEKLLDEAHVRAKAAKAKYMRVYHPTIDRGSCETVKKWIDQGETWIGVGNDSGRVLDKFFSLTGDKVKVHGFAMTKWEMLRRYPFYSADSMSWMAGVVYGMGFTSSGQSISRDQITKERDVWLVTPNKARYAAGMASMKSLERAATSLWSARGVTWK